MAEEESQPTVYLLTTFTDDGVFSVHGVFSTREKAESRALGYMDEDFDFVVKNGKRTKTPVSYEVIYDAGDGKMWRRKKNDENDSFGYSIEIHDVE
jgi:hypothetical protein